MGTQLTSLQPEKPLIWEENFAKDNSQTRAGEHYSYTARVQQLKINPIPARAGDLITEKRPRWIVAGRSYCDVIIDL